MDADDLRDRTKAFGLRVIKLVDALPKSTAGRAIANQIVRSGLSIGANYRAACRARSKAEFVAKIGISEEEADETIYWLEIIQESELLPTRKIESLHQEAVELHRIVAASRITAARNNRKKGRQS